jgi:glycosyltransferase involved in cell wall biosynthesis
VDARFRAVIPAVPSGVERPLWSVMIPTFNCAQFLAEALESVLAQAPDSHEMQIEVIDDASSDHVEAVVRQVGGDRVSFHRHDANIGQIANFTACLRRSRGKLVHLLHGDDRVRPGYYAAMAAGFASDPSIGASFCRWSLIDEDGKVTSTAVQERLQAGFLPHALARLASEQRITTPSIAVRRSVWEELGGFDSRLACAEDWEMWVRIAAGYPVWYDPSPLADYRLRRGSTTDRNTRMAEELRFAARAMEIFGPLLPRDVRKTARGAARSAYSATALRNARLYAIEGDREAMWANLAAAMHFSKRPRALCEALTIALGRRGKQG